MVQSMVATLQFFLFNFQSWISAPLLQSLILDPILLHDPSEIIIIFWFAAQKKNKHIMLLFLKTAE